MENIFIQGSWQPAAATRTFQACNPSTGEGLPGIFPVSSWTDCELALDAAQQAWKELQQSTGQQRAMFLDRFAATLEEHAEELVAIAHLETGLLINPRLANVELPRTVHQLRQAARAAQEESWTQPVLDTKLNIRSCFAGIGPVVVFGPNNFPFAFHGVAGGDLATAIVAGCPVLAKAHPLHPATSRLLAQCAQQALVGCGLPSATVQMLYHLEPEDGLRLVADNRVGATSFTGSRKAGLALKQAADKAGRPIYLELSSLNPIILLPGALAQHGNRLVTESADSGLAGMGQFCTSPNLFFVIGNADGEAFVNGLTEAYSARPSAPLLSFEGLDQLHRGVSALVSAGASLLTGGQPAANTPGACYANTILKVSATQFVAESRLMQTEAFGNATMIVSCVDEAQLLSALTSLEGNLTASIYASGLSDEALYAKVEPILRVRCGRLLNDKMPTGVALSPAMNHGGPYPSTGHSGFTSVGIPRSIQRFCALHCYDGVGEDRLPIVLKDKSPGPQIWRLVDGEPRRG